MSERRLQRKLEREQRLEAAGDKAPARSGLNLARSGLLTAFILLAALVGLGLLWRMHVRSALHQITAVPPPDVAPQQLPGGEEAVVLTPEPLAQSDGGDKEPTYTGATVLPGIGMQLLQLSVAGPTGQPRPLFAAMSISEILAGAQPDAAPFHAELVSESSAETGATAGITRTAAFAVTSQPQPEGGEVAGTFLLRDESGKSGDVNARVSMTMRSHAFEAEVRVRNNSLVNHKLNVDWAPRFLAPMGDLSQFSLRVPSQHQVVEGTVRPVGGVALDYSLGSGRPLANAKLDLTFVDLQRSASDDGPVVSLTDRTTGIVLRIVMLSPSIRSVGVHADPETHTLRLTFGTDAANERTTLAAGESVDWHARMDVLSAANARLAAARTLQGE